MPPTRPATERFFEKVAFSDETFQGTHCLVWTGAQQQGYGSFRASAAVGTVGTHRWLYERWVGPIPDDLELDHLCRNPPCCNPLHLEAVTHAENVARGQGNGSQTHCPKGHPYDEANTYIRKATAKRGGGRMCRACRREGMRGR